MLQKDITIKNKYGIHARPSSKISEIVNEYECQVTIQHNDNEADASSVMSLILLSVEPKSTIKLIVEGEDEENVFQKLVHYLEEQMISEEYEH